MDFIHFWFGSFHKYKSYCRVRDRFVLHDKWKYPSLLDSKTASSNTRHRCQSGQYVPDPNGNYDSLQAGPRYACQNNQCVTSANGPYANITEWSNQECFIGLGTSSTYATLNNTTGSGWLTTSSNNGGLAGLEQDPFLNGLLLRLFLR
jgi:hypothetical protein